MPLDLDGYNATFRKFADFAQANMEQGRTKAIASAVTNPFKKRTVTAITASQTDKVGAFFRSYANETANDRTRTLFYRSVVDMFGGEKNIPESVADAMSLADYDEGKPLTARRIMAVKNAIDACGIPRRRAEEKRLATFQDPVNKAGLVAKGYSKAELPKFARAAHFLCETQHCTEAQALEMLTNPQSPAARIMAYGGRFMENAANFASGLRLIDAFEGWMRQTYAAIDGIHGRDFQDGMTRTVLNGTKSFFDSDVLRGMEKFVFEEIAVNSRLDLNEQDPEAIFGMENNPATSFFGRGLGKSFNQTVANIPPAKRGAFYAAVNLAIPCDPDAATARIPPFRRPGLNALNRGEIIGRVMKNLDKLQKLFDQGELTEKNFVKTCFPEAGRNTLVGLKALFDKWFDEINGNDAKDIPRKYGALAGAITLMMEERGCSPDEAAAALRGGKQPPIPKYVATGALELDSFNGTTNRARNTFEGDANRPSGYSYAATRDQQLLPLGFGFRFAFPDGASFKTNGSREGRAQIVPVEDKIEALCGARNVAQASSVIMMVSQSGLGPLRGGLSAYGIVSDEHSAVDMAFSKDSRSGAVTITYTSPKELPFRFSWTSTVDLDGKVSTSPLKFEKPAENIALADAKKMISDAAKRFGDKLSKAEINAGAALLVEHGTGMYPKNLAYLAAYIARSPLSGTGAAASRTRIADFATSIKEWREFDFGDERMKPLSDALMRSYNSDIRRYFANPSEFGNVTQGRDGIFGAFWEDANRSNFIIGGKKFIRADGLGGAERKQEVTDALKTAVREKKAQKALSVLMCQATFASLGNVASNLPLTVDDEPLEAHDLPGAKLFAQRTLMTGIHKMTLHDPVTTYKLDVAPDGKSAVVTLTHDVSLLMGDALRRHDGSKAPFGKLALTQRFTVDLTQEIPFITDYTMSQKLI